MRTALLSATRRTSAGKLRAGLTLAGRSVLSWQVELALLLECERIVCLCENPGADIIAQQRAVEADGLDFHAVRSHVQLAGLIRADDELIVLLDGLLVDQTATRDLLMDGEKLSAGIMTLSTGHALALAHPDDFERIDRERHWAGLAVMSGRRVQELADLPPDGEAISLLLRLGLQSRVQCRPVPSDHLDDDRWLLADDAQTLERRSGALVEAGLPAPHWIGPGGAFANRLARRVGPRGVASGVEASAATGGVLLLIAAVLAAFGYSVAGLALASVGAFACAVGQSFASLRAHLSPDGDAGALARVIAPALILGMIIILIFAGPIQTSPWTAVSHAIFATGLSWLAGSRAKPAVGAFWRDRTLHFAGFAISGAFGVFGEFVTLFALGALAQLMLRALKD